MNKLWNKGVKQNSIAEVYCFGKTDVLDSQLIKYDVWGNLAHAKMLESIKIISSKDYLKLRKSLKKIVALAAVGNFQIEIGDEDVHTKVENYLTLQLGDLGKKIHTARSRNDQIQVDLRLYSKEKILEISTEVVNLAKLFLLFAKEYEFVPMPGYTHMQKAMPSSVGMWAGSYVQSLIDDLKTLLSAYELNNQSPLGSGAAYGVSILIERELTAKLLGFKDVQVNSLYAQVSRGKSHLSMMHALTQIMLTLSRFAQDMLLFTMSEFNFFTVDQSLCTGSSIMPQKKNLDIMEVLRARSQEVLAGEHSVASIISGLPSGYNADFGETKKHLLNCVENTKDSLEICIQVLKNLKPNNVTLEEACTPEIYATHAAYELVKNGVPFRDAYKQIALSLEKLPSYSAQGVIKSSKHLGATGNLKLEMSGKELEKYKNWYKKESKIFKSCINKLLEGGDKHE